MEAKSLYTWSSGRHCVVAKYVNFILSLDLLFIACYSHVYFRLEDLSIDEFREIRQKAGALVVLLPKDVANMSAEQKEVSYVLL